MIRWWNAGRYERECAEFDAQHPLSREVWKSLQRYPSFRQLCLEWIVRPADSLLAREQRDPWDDFAREVTARWLKALRKRPMVFSV